MLGPAMGPEIISVTLRRDENLACSSLRVMRAGEENEGLCYAFFSCFPSSTPRGLPCYVWAFRKYSYAAQPGGPCAHDGCGPRGTPSPGKRDARPGPWGRYRNIHAWAACPARAPVQQQAPPRPRWQRPRIQTHHFIVSFHMPAGSSPPTEETASQRRLVPFHGPFVASPCTTTRARSRRPPPSGRTMISYG